MISKGLKDSLCDQGRQREEPVEAEGQVAISFIHKWVDLLQTFTGCKPKGIVTTILSHDCDKFYLYVLSVFEPLDKSLLMQ